MSLDHLRTNEFWKKKLRAFVKAQDVDQDNLITREDFDLIVQRYKEAGASPEHIKKHQEINEKVFTVWGMTDKNVQLTIEEFEEMFRQKLEETYSHAHDAFSSLFSQVDINDNGEISLKEWIIHCSAINISKENAGEVISSNGHQQRWSDLFGGVCGVSQRVPLLKRGQAPQLNPVWTIALVTP